MGWFTTIRRNRIDTPIACLAIYALLLHAVIAGLVTPLAAGDGETPVICTLASPAGDDAPGGSGSTDDPLCRSLCAMASVLAIPAAPAGMASPEWDVAPALAATCDRPAPTTTVVRLGARAPPASA